MQMLVCTLFILLPAISGTDCTCKDDESVDCTELNSKIGICDTIHKAKIICKKYCNLCDIDDGNWSPWSSWAKCDVTCGKGSLLRSRTCDNPAPQNGGLDCAGKSMELKTCNMPLCPVHGGWTLWGHWEKCSATCGVGMRSRTRSCTNPPPQRFGDHCFGQSIADELCSNGTCPVDGSWTAWSHWGKCSVSCGVGLLTRLRSCTNPSTTNAGNQCTGQNIEVKLCYPGLCEDSDCYDIGTHLYKPKSGVHHIRLWKSRKIIPVYCDFDTNSGGWTVFQHRFNGTADFNRNFSDYKSGFGSLNGEFWLGLEYIYEMVSQGKTELRLDLNASDGDTAYETFPNFQLEQGPSYTFHFDKGSGTAGDGLTSTHNGQKFSTFDFDQDANPGNCAKDYRGGWWYNSCFTVNLNSAKMYYHAFKHNEPLKATRMMFRRV